MNNNEGGANGDNGRNGIIEYRRSLIASLLIRIPTIRQRQLQSKVGERIINPDTEKPYSLGTIHNDIQQIKMEWMEKAGQDYGEWIAEELAGLAEVEAAAWVQDKLDIVLRCKERRAKLMGFDALDKHIRTWQERAEADGYDPDVFLHSLSEQFAQHMVEEPAE